MGTSSCLKIIVCGSDSPDNEDAHSPQAKGSSDKRGWSFRKKSGRHRVLGNNVSSETTTFPEKETPQSGSIDFQSPVKSANVDEKPQLPKPVEEFSKTVVGTENDSELKKSVVVGPSENGAICAESKFSQDEVALERVSNETSAEHKLADVAIVSENDSNETSDESSIANDSCVSKDESIESAEFKISEPVMASDNICDDNVVLDETAAINIQTAMRGFLAQQKLVQLKSAIKLQAVIRGHLVRRHAVGTLHCIRAIVKVQALVRARNSKSLGQKIKPNDAHFSTVKLLQNSFARQLLESTSKPKSLNIRCDPMRPNSAWSWLERWMSVSKSEVVEKLEPSVEAEKEIEVQKIATQAGAEVSSVALLDSVESKFCMKKGEELLENEKNYVVDDVNTVDSCSPCSLPTEFMTEQPQIQKQEIVNEDVASAKIEANETEIPRMQAEPISLEDEPATMATEIQQPKLSTKRSASSELNDEGKKFVYGSRKASSPAFIAAQSKFEELTSAANPGGVTITSHEDVGLESHVNSVPYLEESVKKTNTPAYVEASGTSYPRIHVAGSECGTELSISSTLDSPDRSEIENTEAEPEVQLLEEASCPPDVREKQDCEANDLSSKRVTDVPSVMIQQGEVRGTNDISVDPVDAEVCQQLEDKLETKASDVKNDVATVGAMTNMDSSPVEQTCQEIGNDVHTEHGLARDHQAYKPSPESSPISHKTVPESQGTPSSQASVKGKRNKIDKHGSNRKRSFPSAEKRSPSNPNIDSGARSSTEHLPKDHKSGKRRNSFGSAKSDTADQEPRESSSRSSLPSYMQATESARAKANSPRSSPDVHDKELYSKKRHSLPGATGRQVSPQIHRLTPEVTEGVKANGSQPSTERKWQR